MQPMNLNILIRDVSTITTTMLLQIALTPLFAKMEELSLTLML